MIQSIKHYFNQHPLRFAIFAGLLFRLIAVIFSKGFGFFDDHFLVLEAAQSWVDGTDYNNWLPSATDPTKQPQGHPFFYVGIHFLILKFFTFLGLTDPQGKLYFIRLFHALWSMLIIYFGFKIAYKRSNLKVASWVGLALALYWFIPFLSVRNLIETVCIPPMVIATWLILKNDKDSITFRDSILTGAMLALAFTIRFQSSIFTAGFGLALLIMRVPFRTLVYITLSFLITIFITLGLPDIYIWGKPFAEFMAYVQYNIDNASAYGVDIWHMYISLLLGLLIPPISILLFVGYFKNWKKEALLFWPTLLFFAFHTYFPNKQERFILPVVPFIIILGCIGAFQIIEKRQWNTKRWAKNTLIFVLIINAILLPVLSVSYSKRNRVEAMCYIAKRKDCVRLIVEDSNQENDVTMPPRYYLQNWTTVYGITKNFTPDNMLTMYNELASNERPNYVVFMQAEHIEARVDSLKKRFPTLQYLETIEPSFIDKTMHFLNPLNENYTTYVYKLN